MKKRIWNGLALALAIAALLTLTACMGGVSPEPDAEPEQEETMQTEPADSESEQAAVTFSTRDLEGNAVTEAVFGDADLTMLNVWATFCGPCLSEMPDLGVLAEEYSGKGVQIIGVVSDVGDSESDIAQVQQIIAETGANYRHLLPSDNMQSGLLANMMYVPTTLFFDRNGNQVNGEIVGSKSKADWEAVIDRMLQLATANDETAEPAGE